MAMPDDYRHALNNAALFDLSGRGLIELSGKDAVTFLHNLCTNDIKGLAPGFSCEAFLTTVKAKVVAHLFVNRLRPNGGRALWLDLSPDQADKVTRHLDHFLISEDVQLSDRSGEITQLHLCGPGARAVLEKVLSAANPELKELADYAAQFGAQGGGLVRRHDYLGLPGYDIFCPSSDADNIRSQLISAGAAPASSKVHEILRVEAGFPLYGKDIDEDRFVVEVGRTRQAISYGKGCYLGQEPIVMARDRGHVNRSLLGLVIREGGPASPGARVVRGQEGVGRVTSSALSPRLGCAVALAYLRRGSQEPGTPVQIESEGRLLAAEVTGLPLVRR
jgi:folate-binding protein YgfZ